MESLIREIEDLSPADRRAVEALVGHPLAPKGQVFVALLEELTDDQRRQWELLCARVAPFHRNVAATGAPQADLEDEIDQTITEVRTGRH